MTALPLTILWPTLPAVMSGRCTRLRRPADGIYAGVQPGDRLWIREPFHLKRKYNGLSPTAADLVNARPYFAADLGPGVIEREELGPRRVARNLLRDWHRQHVIVLEVERQPLMAITDAEARAEGFGGFDDWADAWDRGQAGFAGRTSTRLWEFNPTVLVLTLRRVPLKVPEDDPTGNQQLASATLARMINATQGSNMIKTPLLDQHMREYRAREERLRLANCGGTVANVVPIARPTPVLEQPTRPADPRPPAFGRNPCPRCGTRGDLGCQHFAPCETAVA